MQLFTLHVHYACTLSQYQAPPSTPCWIQMVNLAIDTITQGLEMEAHHVLFAILLYVYCGIALNTSALRLTIVPCCTSVAQTLCATAYLNMAVHCQATTI